MKICPCCKRELDNSFFYRDKNRKDGLHGTCKKCSNASSKKWLDNHPEFREKQRVYCRDYARGNPERNRSRVSIWNKEHPGVASARAKQWKLEHPDKAKISARIGLARRRARKRMVYGDFSWEEFECLKNRFGGECLCCKKPERDVTLVPDHVFPLCKGGDNTILNIQPLCIRCNCKKNSKHIDYRTKEIVVYRSV